MMNFYTFLVLSFPKIIWTINPCKYLLLIWCHLNKNMFNLEVPGSTLQPILSVKIFLTWRSLDLHYSPINTGRIILQITDICSSFWKESFYYIPIGTRDTRRIKNSYKHSYSYSNFHNAVTLSKIFRALFFKEIKEKPSYIC